MPAASRHVEHALGAFWRRELAQALQVVALAMRCAGHIALCGCAELRADLVFDCGFVDVLDGQPPMCDISTLGEDSVLAPRSSE